MWYHRKIGGGRCPIVDTWWQTETGGIMMSPLPGAIATKPGSCTKPLPGIVPEIVGEDGRPVDPGKGGWLVITRPWPGMLRGIWGDDERYQRAILEQGAGASTSAGDNARCDEDGYYWIMGRIDDVLNVSGHRLSTIEIESALVSHPRGGRGRGGGPSRRNQGRGGGGVRHALRRPSPARSCGEELKNHVRQEIGALAVPDDIRFTAALPKTRSGKIMRRLLRGHRRGPGDGRRHHDVGRLQRACAAARAGGGVGGRGRGTRGRGPGTRGRGPRHSGVAIRSRGERRGSVAAAVVTVPKRGKIERWAAAEAARPPHDFRSVEIPRAAKRLFDGRSGPAERGSG